MDVLRVYSLRTMAVLLAIRKLGGSATCPEIIGILRRCKAESLLEVTGAPDGKYGSIHNRLRKAVGNGTLTRTMNYDKTRGKPGKSHVYHMTDGSLALVEQWLQLERELGAKHEVENHGEEMSKIRPMVRNDPQAPAYRATSQPPSLGSPQHKALGDDRREGDAEGADAGVPWGVYQPDPE